MAAHDRCTVEDFEQLLCVEFQATFIVDIECEVTNVECLGPCPPEEEPEVEGYTE